MSRRFYGLALLATGILFAAEPTNAQDVDVLRPAAAYFGIQPLYARPVGEFRDYVEHGGGLGLNVVWPVRVESPLALRADGGFIVYGSETRSLCFPGSCRVEVDITTTNSIAFLNVGPQLMLPEGTFRPYVNAGAGFSYFNTTSSIKGSDNNNDPFASTNNFDDITFSWAGGGGLLISLSSGHTPILLDLSARYHGNGNAEYLKKGDIIDNPDGSITLTPTRSEANLMTFQVGVSIGARAPQR
jgi:hypothetical protein